MSFYSTNFLKNNIRKRQKKREKVNIIKSQVWIAHQSLSLSTGTNTGAGLQPKMEMSLSIKRNQKGRFNLELMVAISRSQNPVWLQSLCSVSQHKLCRRPASCRCCCCCFKAETFPQNQPTGSDFSLRYISDSSASCGTGAMCGPVNVPVAEMTRLVRKLSNCSS